MAKGEGMDALLIAAGPPKLGSGKGAGGEDDTGPMGAKVRTAKRLMAAQDAGDAVGYAKAWKEMYELCAASHGSESPSDDESPEDDDSEAY